MIALSYLLGFSSWGGSNCCMDTHSRVPFVSAYYLSFPALFILFTFTAYAVPVVTVISPKAGISGGSPVFYEAYAVSSGCAKGISAIRIYTAPGVMAFTTSGDHLETFVQLKAGSYNTVVQAWDNCGGVGKTAVAIKINATAGVTVYLPSGKTDSSPIHIAASAQNSACAKGINAIRIYTASSVSPYTVNASQLDAYVSLPAKNYAATVQAWDNCGHVFKSAFPLAVSGSAAGYLYSSYGTADKGVAKLNVTADGSLSNPNGEGDPPIFAAAGAFSATSDPGGWFVYVSADKGIFGFQVNPANGSLTSIAGSPFASPQSVMVQVDPSGNFLYSIGNNITTYRINRSSGALTATNKATSIPVGASQFTSTDQYFYLLGSSQPVEILGFKLDSNTGALIGVPGSPYRSLGSGTHMLDVLTASGKFLFAGANLVSSGNISGEIFTFAINNSNGALSLIARPPLLAPQEDQQLSNIWADAQRRFAWALWQDTTGTGNSIAAYDIESDGSLVPTGFAVAPPYPGAFNFLQEDGIGQHLFTFWEDATQQGVATWDISNGDVTLTSHVALEQSFPSFAALASQNLETLVRKHPN
jgi:6-phosphogluconolactonase (cycloisomerase 2 family)